MVINKYQIIIFYNNMIMLIYYLGGVKFNRIGISLHPDTVAANYEWQGHFNLK